MQSKFLKIIVTRYFIELVAFIIILGLAFEVLLFNKKFPIDAVNKAVDTSFKLIAIMLGFVWFLNRYFSERKDMPVFDITVDLNSIEVDEKLRLLIYRMDLFNRGNVLFAGYESYMRIDGYEVTNGQIKTRQIQRLPDIGYGEGLPIEPNSWTAINSELLIDRQILALRFYYEIREKGNTLWTWHKTFKLASETAQGNCPEIC